MTFDSHHIHIIGRHRQGQHTLVTSRSQGQIQGHEGRFRFLAVFTRICIFEKVAPGHRSRGRPKSGSTGTGDKLVILVHFFALFLTPPTVLIGEC